MEAKLAFLGHALMENRSGLVLDARLTRIAGYAELRPLEMIAPLAERPRAVTRDADNGFDAAEFVIECRELNVTPHVAQNTSGRRPAIDARTTRHAGYARASARGSASRSPRVGQDARGHAQD